MVSSVLAGPTVFDGGRFTPFTSAGHGACGQMIDASTGFFASVGQAHFTSTNPNEDRICGQCIEVSYNGQKLTLPIVDKCGGCDKNDLLLSAPAFQHLANSKSAWEINGGNWKFAPCTPPPTPPPTPTEQPIIFVGNGEISYYSSAGYAACGGQVNGSADWNVGMSSYYFTTVNSNNDPLCQKCVQISHQGVLTKLPIKDKCGGCPKNRIMVSKPVMQILVGYQGDYLPAQIENASWEVVPC